MRFEDRNVTALTFRVKLYIVVLDKTWGLNLNSGQLAAYSAGLYNPPHGALV